MAKSFRPKRNFTAKSDVFIGKPYEVTLDCERQELRIHDGITAGGIPTARNVDLKQSTRVSHTQYAVGDTVACPKRAGVYLVCANAGKTSSSDLDFANAVPGSTVVDGTVSWIVTVPFVTNINGIGPDADGRVNVSFVSSVNGVEPDPAGDVSLKDSNAYQIPFGTCSTSSTISAKVATITNGATFSLVQGSIVAIKFSKDPADFTTLNVNSSGAKEVRKHLLFGQLEDSMTHGVLSIAPSNLVFVFVFDGTYWNLVTAYGAGEIFGIT